MYSSYDFDYFIEQSFMPYMYNCRDCKIRHLCKKSKDGRLPCGFGRFLSFLYSKYKVPFYDICIGEDRDFINYLGCILNFMYQETNERFVVFNSLYRHELFIWLFERFVDVYDFSSGVEIGYSTLDNIYELAKDRHDGNYQALQGLIHCNCLFLDDLYIDKNNKYNKQLFDMLNYRKSQRCVTIFRLRKEKADAVKTLQYFNLEGAIIL